MSQYKEWAIQVFNKRTNTYVDDSSGKAYVMNEAQTLVTSSTLVTLKSDQQGTALTQPVTLSGGLLRFFTAKSVTSVDVTIVTADGYSIYAKGITSSVHRLDIYPEDRFQLLVFPMLFLAGGTVVDTGIDLPIGLLIQNAFIRVLVVDATETVDIGILASETGGDENGFMAAADVAALGLVIAPLGVLIDGPAAYSATNFDHVYLTDGVAKSLTYTPTSSDTFKGLGFIEYRKL